MEREKDSLWAGLQVLEQARIWYRRILEDNRARQANMCTRAGARAKEWGGEVWGRAVSYYSEMETVFHR